MCLYISAPHLSGHRWCTWVHPGQDTSDAIWGGCCLFQETDNIMDVHAFTSHYFPSCWSWRTPYLFSFFLILFHCRIITRWACVCVCVWGGGGAAMCAAMMCFLQMPVFSTEQAGRREKNAAALNQSVKEQFNIYINSLYG